MNFFKLSPVSFRKCPNTLFIGAGFLSLIPIWVVKYLPMVDLPQHAAQIAIWKNLHNSSYSYAQTYFVNWFTPYVASLALTRLFHEFFSIHVALKITISLSILALPLALYFLLRELEGNEWLAIVGYPLAFSYGFYWGFFSFNFAVPVGIFFVALGLNFLRVPNFFKGCGLALTGIALFFSHAIVFGICGLILGSFLIKYIRPFYFFLFRLLPLLPAAGISLWWYFGGYHPPAQGLVIWGNSWVARIPEFFYFTLDNRTTNPAFAASILLIVGAGLGFRFSSVQFRRLLPLFLTLGFFLFSPHHALDISLIYERLPVLAFVFYLASFPLAIGSKRLWLSRIVTTGVSLAWLIYITFNFISFDKVARDFDKILDFLEPNKKVLGLNYYEASCMFPESFKHFAAWYQAVKGGEVGNTFSFAYKSPVRFLPGVNVGANAGADPRSGNWLSREDVDFYIVRESEGRSEFEKQKGIIPVSLVLRSGNWSLYKKVKK